jgi:hypothetical protein
MLDMMLDIVDNKLLPEFCDRREGFSSEPKTIFILGFEVKKGDRLSRQGEGCGLQGEV